MLLKNDASTNHLGESYMRFLNTQRVFISSLMIPFSPEIMKKCDWITVKLNEKKN